MKRHANRRPTPGYDDRPDRAKTRYRAVHEHNPPGTKLLRRVHKTTTGERLKGVELDRALGRRP